MNTSKRDSLINLLLTTPDNGIVCAPHLLKSGLTHGNIKQYVKNGRLDAVGRGAYCKHGHTPGPYAAINAAARQLQIPIHLGGWSALAKHGLIHFIPFGQSRETLYVPVNVRLPAWLVKAFGEKLSVKRTNALPTGLSVVEETFDGFAVPTSTPERAFVEYLLGVPEEHPLNEAYQILEMMSNARPEIFQGMVERCSSVKTKRLFFLLAEDVNHAWYEDLDRTRVDFGSGCRTVEKGGVYRAKWQVVVKDWRDI